MFPGTQKSTPPTVFNLQTSDWVHYEEETGAYYQLSPFTYNFVIFFLNLKLFILRKKNMLFSKNSLKFIIFLFFKKR